MKKLFVVFGIVMMMASSASAFCVQNNYKGEVEVKYQKKGQLDTSEVKLSQGSSFCRDFDLSMVDFEIDLPDDRELKGRTKNIATNTNLTVDGEGDRAQVLVAVTGEMLTGAYILQLVSSY